MKRIELILPILLALTILLISLLPVYATAITMGNAATDRASSSTASYTYLDIANPATGTGTINSIELWASVSLSGTNKVGTFYLTSGTNYKCRDSETLGTITAGSKQTVVVDLTVVTGDVIGLYWSNGSLERDETGGSSMYVSGDYADPNDETTYTAGARILSLYATGTTSATTPIVTTQATSDVSYTTATGNGNITNTGGEDASKRGICYSSSTNPPTVADSKVEETGSTYGTGAFTESLTSLDPGTLYYARAYAYNSAGYGYGSTVQFTTLTQSPTVTTQAATSITMDKDGLTAGTFNGNLTNLGDDTDADVSFEWDSNSGAPYANETTPQNLDATGAFTDDIATNLTPGGTYYYRSKAVNVHGTSYGSEQSFTFTMPTFTTETATYTSPGAASATLEGNISSMQTASNTTAYFEWGYDTGYGNTTVDQIISGTGDITQAISGFLHNVTIHYRMVLENGATAVNGSDSTFLIAPNALAEVLWYQPNTIISGTTLPDRDSTEDGVITWGTNPAGITYTVGALIPVGGYSTPTPPSDPPISEVPTQPNHMYSELSLDFFGAGLFVLLADLTGIPLAIWVFGYAFGLALVLGLIAYRLSMGKVPNNRGSLFIQALVSTSVMIYFTVAGDGVIPAWVLIPFVIECIAIIMWRQSPSPW
jgi:hypothetical protein